MLIRLLRNENNIKRLLALIMLIAPAVAMAAKHPEVTFSVKKWRDVQTTIEPGLYLEISGRFGFPQVKVYSDRGVPHCYQNLIRWTGHGPQPGDIMGWTVKKGWYSTPTEIPVCGYPLKVRIRVKNVTMGKNGFASGSIIATVLPGKLHNLND